MPDVYSHSRLSSFENCPKQFWFRYVEELPQETEGIEAFVGKRVHEVLERLYLFVEQRQLPSLDKVVTRYHALWDEHWDAERIRIVKEEFPADHYRQLGERCLGHYYRRHYPFDGDTTLGLEEHVTFQLDADGRYRMQGIIDRIVETRDGTVEIHDFKTGAWVPSQKKLDEDRQLALYQIGLHDRYGDRPMRLVWHYLQKGQRRTSTRTPEQLDTLKRDTIALIDRIEAETDYPTRETNLCRWCEYRPHCPLFAETENATKAAPTLPAPEPSTPALPSPTARQLDLL